MTAGSSIESLRDVLVPNADEEIPGLNILDMVKTMNFWLFLWPCVALIGAGIGMTTNIAQMFNSIGEDEHR